jgi:hypothetical protein
MKKLVPGFSVPVRAGIAHAPKPDNNTIIAEVFIPDLQFVFMGPTAPVRARTLPSTETDSHRRDAPAKEVFARAFVLGVAPTQSSPSPKYR